MQRNSLNPKPYMERQMVAMVCVHSAHDHIQNGGEGFPAVGVAIAHQLARVPQQQRPCTDAESVGEAQPQPLGQPSLLPQLQRGLQLLGIRTQSTLLADVSIHRAHLRDHLQK